MTPDEVREDIKACKARIKILKDELGGLQADKHELEEQLGVIEEQVKEKSAKLEQEEARLANLEVESQTSG